MFPGFVQGKDKEKLFRECGLFVIPSYHEGLPFALLEAMSYGCHILASDIPVHKEIGLPDKCYFPCGNIKALAEKIEEFYLCQSYPVDYDEKLKERYNWEIIAKRTFDLYKSFS
jgi:glycosyltransferase involved in cell wall biosynthesis